MIAMLIAAAALAGASPRCAGPKSGAKIVQRLELPSHDESLEKKRTLIATSEQISGLGPFDTAATRLTIQSDHCEELFEQEFEGTQNIKLSLIQMSKTPFLVVSTVNYGGSSCGIEHVLISYDGEVRLYAPTRLAHDNMGSLFVGDLGQGRGAGLALLDAQWVTGAHGDPHPYRVSIYRWEDGHFSGPELKITKPMRPDPAGVAKSLGLPFSNELSFSDC